MYTLMHGHFANFDDVPDSTTLNKSELPSGVLILALQVVGLYLLLLAAVAVYCSDHFIRFTMLSTHGALECLSKTPLQRASFRQICIYGDGIRCEAGPNGKMKAFHVNTALQYLPTIKALILDH